MRLDAFLAGAGVGSRNDAKKLIRKGKVTVDGAVIKRAEHSVDRSNVITCHGEPVELPPAELHLALHKPPGYACSRTPAEAPLVYELLPDNWRGIVEPAGRLDRATSGLLILSTDGNLLHRLIHPRKKIPKRYRIMYHGALVNDAIERCEQGIMLEGDTEPTAPAELTLHDPDGDMQRATMIIREGRYHQVRRMIAALGGEVMHLHRDAIGAYRLPTTVEPGQWAELSEAELKLLQAPGGTA